MKKRYRLPPQNATRVRHLGLGLRLAAPRRAPEPPPADTDRGSARRLRNGPPLAPLAGLAAQSGQPANAEPAMRKNPLASAIRDIASPETNLVSAELYITMTPERRLPSGLRRRYPDLLIALDVDPAAYHESNGYIIGEQGKPPDFVLEVASASTADQDTGPKRLDYEALGVAEYWRFDETGEHHKTRLAGDRLANGVYEPIAAEELADGVLQGYSAALNLFIRWEHGRLAWHDPATGQHIATFESERARAESEREARLAAETRVREMEERLGQQNA